MWNRSDIKSYAKEFLQKNYWKAFVVVLIVTLLNGGSGTGNTNQQIQINPFESNYWGLNEVNTPSFYINLGSRIVKSPIFLLASGYLVFTAVLIAIIFILIGFVIEVGQSKFFLDGFKGDVNINKLFSVFNATDYLPIIKTQFLRSFYNFLWTLLLIIPGIIKSYEYRFVPYILAEYPTLPSKAVIARSREITQGHKLDMFVLDLSFIGWYMLGALAFGIGVYFVNPYREATNARLYNVLSNSEISTFDYNDIL